MESSCVPQCKAVKLLIVGLVLILASMYTSWNMWVVIGALLIVKAIYVFVWPTCPCCVPEKKKR